MNNNATPARCLRSETEADRMARYISDLLADAALSVGDDQYNAGFRSGLRHAVDYLVAKERKRLKQNMQEATEKHG